MMANVTHVKFKGLNMAKNNNNDEDNSVIDDSVTEYMDEYMMNNEETYSSWNLYRLVTPALILESPNNGGSSHHHHAIFYNEKKNILFPLIHKNASTSIVKYMTVEYPNMFRELEFNNSELRKQQLEEIADRNPRICVVMRDPFARFISSAAMHAWILKRNYGLSLDLDAFKYIDAVVDPHFVPQWVYVPLNNVTDVRTTNARNWKEAFEHFKQHNVITQCIANHDFFYMSEDKERNVLSDIIEHYQLPPSTRMNRENSWDKDVSKDTPVSAKDIKQWMDAFTTAYSCDYEFMSHIKYTNI